MVWRQNDAAIESIDQKSWRLFAEKGEYERVAKKGHKVRAQQRFHQEARDATHAAPQFLPLTRPKEGWMPKKTVHPLIDYDRFRIKIILWAQSKKSSLLYPSYRPRNSGN
jgi:hypothetical protein